jgi:response regulator NasT
MVATPDSRPLRVLLIDDGAHRVRLIRDELVSQGHEVVGVMDSARVIHDAVQQLHPDAVIVDSDSPSRDTLEHLAALSEANPRPVVVFAEDPADDPMRRAMAAGVSAYVVAGLQPQRVASVLRVAIVRFEQDRQLRTELAEARQQLSQRKVIDRAKGLIMKRQGLAEDEAYALMRKTAMDKGLKLAELAQRLVDAADLLGS